MQDKELEKRRASQLKEEEIESFGREQASFEEATFNFSRSLKKSQQQLEENKGRLDKSSNFETLRAYENDIALLWQISSKVQSLSDEALEEFRDKKRHLLGELEKLESSKSGKEGKNGE
ncbi:MAG: hypothetical protein LBI13_07810 [Streptococcaceae bacterium]|jgi:hypothetical protein|nr:hypothetical protein [Streptococcaceae bacterium]